MPDVTRSDSQRSDASLRPRVSFNRDVHVKRIVPREGGRVGALSGDGEGHLLTSPVRKERVKKSKQELAKEAARVIHQVDKIDCVSKGNGVLPEKFYTLPVRRKNKGNTEFNQSSLDRRKRRNSDDTIPPKKPPRTFVHSPQRNSIFNIFHKTEKEIKPKKSNLRRSVSDASNLKTKGFDHVKIRTKSESEETQNLKGSKKQLSPIIEVTPREDYFENPNLSPSTSFKENDKNVDNEIKAPTRKKGNSPPKQSITEKLKEYIDEVDAGLVPQTEPKKIEKIPEIVIIDVDKAEKISNKSKPKSTLSKKLKSITSSKKKNKAKDTNTTPVTPVLKNNKVKTGVKSEAKTEVKPEIKTEVKSEEQPASRIKETIESLEHPTNNSPKMIHSSQQPVDKLPLTRGRTVDTMVKRLSHESSSPPLKTSIMISPNVSVQHNNNQPFSYTRGVSPDRSPTSPTNPIIYAQVVCGNGTGNKQTVHTAYTNGKKHLPHSDSDEGLGYEENSGFRSSEKSITHFGDETYKSNFYNDDRFEEEFPITPKFKSNGYNGYSYENKFGKEQRIFIDSSSRGRGDGMDSKRRESLTEPQENGELNNKFNGSQTNLNGRKDLSARRDLLESRINRRFGEKTMRNSPEYSPKANVYVTETSSRYYRSGSASPIGFKEKFVSETKTDRHGNQYTTNSHSKKYLGDDYNKVQEYRYNYDNEPKSFDSQLSDYRSSPENVNRHFETSHKSSHQSKYVSKNEKQQLSKDRDYYKSNPEITQRTYNYDDHRRYQDTYHDSLKRENGVAAKHGRYFDQNDCERKDKFGDSGIENDFRRDSGERRPKREVREASNDSEDEGFASSLLIASERQHTEDNFARRNRTRGYESDRGYNREDDGYRHVENTEYKTYKSKQNYAPRERSIDDGSHFDPRIDKNEKGTLKKVDKKPPKPEKKSSLEKMKQLFTGSKKKKDKPGMAREESLRATRYTEYKGHKSEPKVYRKEISETNMGYDYNNRRRLSTPSPSPTRELQRNGKTEPTHGSWFKSLDRLSRKKTKKGEREGNLTSTEDEVPKPTKSLRFFGDTDIESNDSIRHKSALKSRPGLSHRDRMRSQSSRDLHNISEESHKTIHKSMLNISADSDRDTKGSRMSLKPPASPSHRNRELSRSREERGRRRKNEVSSVESSTEGDSSQQSQRSVVYLHAATVGDIPGPGYLRNGRRAASREELASNSSSKIQPQVKTLSRSFSVLAPWKPRHYREGMDIDYTQYPKPVKNGKYEQNKSGSSRKESSTLKKKAQESRRSNQNMSTLNRKSRSKENISTLKRTSEAKGSTSSLYKKKETRQPKESNRYNREDKRIASKTMSVESLGSNRSRKGEVSRSISMPRDPEKSAGWFNMSKKSKKTGSTQRL